MKFGYTAAFFLAKILDPRSRGNELTMEERGYAYDLLNKKILKNPIFAPFSSKVF
jgi:hypothetical protein